MSNNTIILLTSLALLAIGSLMVLNFAPTIVSQITVKPVPPLQVRTISVVVNGTPYTLNQEQQKIAFNAIQNAEEVKKSDYANSHQSFNFEKIIIKRFNGNDLEIFPIQYKEANLIFSAPALSEENYYIELSGGALKKMLSSVHD